ncbi:hypothetical protein D9613_008994 [Agrocybe pediades]|uniref:Uncharacterized protein n=1 Tax=Agrocybe pediades TaxID=84607 RepID=A0A8H4R2V7_9AGAR|nr:hypothetical protein D9613_008994 [Agrocybe pediades]
MFFRPPKFLTSRSVMLRPKTRAGQLDLESSAHEVFRWTRICVFSLFKDRTIQQSSFAISLEWKFVQKRSQELRISRYHSGTRATNRVSSYSEECRASSWWITRGWKFSVKRNHATMFSLFARLTRDQLLIHGHHPSVHLGVLDYIVELSFLTLETSTMNVLDAAVFYFGAKTKILQH